ncbi:RagB/SusD family nutrient uptake outer membrane protein [Hymenobacter lutimineralis]|uniref:RagB/SusD family nutrient uptake outer membrane protein n=1 Tax=Hymenobacter lutimineralis TaxID=2606448 RepID=A0A5D6VIR5_9BACT|nr:MULTISPECIES: RagB/SusD family nutrient uptake outer membrane protein [Hymenobacter]QIX60297.1 RagB/SusD family nutrient uptake outer membrane protein [Hymenobacter sp. BT18]TYZ14284.1 RagB/SusD family nutrient uptake outer membrane protein [Hymenobacter lutimineralis]
MSTAYLKTVAFFASIAVAFSVSACADFLDVEPRESIADDLTVTDQKSAATALNGVYSALASGGYYGTSFQSIGYLTGDNVQWTGTQSQVQEFINHNVRADNSTISTVWSAIYVTINRANHVISKVPAVTDPLLTEALRNQYVGEAYFLRALAYFDLARTFGGVPIITEPTLSATANQGIPRATQAETYAQVLRDLETAEPLLPNPATVATNDRYRATRKTVWALKARLYLYQQNWALAEEYATRLISDNANYQLVAPFNAWFTGNVRGTRESVFELFYNGTTEVNGHRGQWQPTVNGGTRQWAPNQALVSLLTTEPNNAANGRSALIAAVNNTTWYGNLYYRSPGSDPSYIFRIAELYLIRAEALAQQGKLPEALADLNAVRGRAGLEASPAATPEEVLLAIEQERRLEFALEPHRWFDLVRTGRATALFKDPLDVNAPLPSFRLVLPIPISQLQVDAALKQNEGY